MNIRRLDALFYGFCAILALSACGDVAVQSGVQSGSTPSVEFIGATGDVPFDLADILQDCVLDKFGIGGSEADGHGGAAGSLALTVLDTGDGGADIDAVDGGFYQASMHIVCSEICEFYDASNHEIQDMIIEIIAEHFDIASEYTGVQYGTMTSTHSCIFRYVL